MADEFVRQKLREWGLQDHIEKFQGKSYVVADLRCIGISTVTEPSCVYSPVLSYVGHVEWRPNSCHDTQGM